MREFYELEYFLQVLPFQRVYNLDRLVWSYLWDNSYR